LLRSFFALNNHSLLDPFYTAASSGWTTAARNSTLVVYVTSNCPSPTGCKLFPLLLSHLADGPDTSSSLFFRLPRSGRSFPLIRARLQGPIPKKTFSEIQANPELRHSGSGSSSSFVRPSAGFLSFSAPSYVFELKTVLPLVE
jgi:hypothetical protein